MSSGTKRDFQMVDSKMYGELGYKRKEDETVTGIWDAHAFVAWVHCRYLLRIPKIIQLLTDLLHFFSPDSQSNYYHAVRVGESFLCNLNLRTYPLSEYAFIDLRFITR